MLRYFPFAIILFIFSCNNSESGGLSEDEIDAYVEECLDTSIVYDIVPGLRYSKNDQSYQVTEYSLNDTTVLFYVEDVSENQMIVQNIYFKDSAVVFVQEFIYEYPEEYTKTTERKVYFNGPKVIAAYERSGETDKEADEKEFEEIDRSFADYDFGKPRKAIDQQGEFEMMYGEFLIISPEAYLVLENDKSGYGVALFILQGDMLLDELYDKPEIYKGKTVYINHEFMTMNGVERMIYRGGIVKE